MNQNIRRKIKLLQVAAMLPLLVGAQDTIWVRKNAPTEKETYSVAFSADGARVFSGSECSPAYLRVFATVTGSVSWEYELGGTLMCVSGVKMSTDGTHVAATEELGNLLIFDYSGSTPVLENTVSTGTSGAFALDFSPDGTKIVTGCTNNKMNIYRVSDGGLLHTITAHNTWVMSVDWSPNGNFVVSGGSDNLVRLWDTSGMLIRTMTGHTGAVQSVRFSADGNYIISGSKDDRIKVWESATGNLVRTIFGHGGDVMQVDISDNGERIVSGSADSTIRVWNFATGGQLMQFGIPSSGKVYTVDFAPDNHHVAVGTAKGDVQLWDIELPTAVADEMQPGSALQVCPNPFTESIFIAGPEAVVAFTVTDMAGKDVRGNYVSGKYFSISLAGLPQGVYVLSVLTANGNTYRRSIVKNGFN